MKYNAAAYARAQGYDLTKLKKLEELAALEGVKPRQMRNRIAEWAAKSGNAEPQNRQKAAIENSKPAMQTSAEPLPEIATFDENRQSDGTNAERILDILSRIDVSLAEIKAAISGNEKRQFPAISGNENREGGYWGDGSNSSSIVDKQNNSNTEEVKVNYTEENASAKKSGNAKAAISGNAETEQKAATKPAKSGNEAREPKTLYEFMVSVWFNSVQARSGARPVWANGTGKKEGAALNKIINRLLNAEPPVGEPIPSGWQSYAFTGIKTVPGRVNYEGLNPNEAHALAEWIRILEGLPLLDKFFATMGELTKIESNFASLKMQKPKTVYSHGNSNGHSNKIAFNPREIYERNLIPK